MTDDEEDEGNDGDTVDDNATVDDDEDAFEYDYVADFDYDGMVVDHDDNMDGSALGSESVQIGERSVSKREIKYRDFALMDRNGRWVVIRCTCGYRWSKAPFKYNRAFKHFFPKPFPQQGGNKKIPKAEHSKLKSKIIEKFGLEGRPLLSNSKSSTMFHNTNWPLPLLYSSP
ncbi:hypothetical protein B0H63DRAFT_212451 [Podospora didyma]|uniref:Uncharacterized protein n=1 Tax=Podospora didyma TaxID=330526 RepID=A0AAE0NHS1_9PEZI|nr:hypothetical protein B0H63DRAFT_212451 [Podospora didyma]